LYDVTLPDSGLLHFIDNFNFQSSSGETMARKSKTDAAAIRAGQKHAESILKLRAKKLKKRAAVLKALPPVKTVQAAKYSARLELVMAAAAQSAGTLVAEGDSWFNYPGHDILKLLYEDYGYDVESVAHRGDPIEAMAYGESQLDDFASRIEKVVGRGETIKAILLSGGGDDIAGDEFGMLINFAGSPISGWNEQVVAGVIDQRIRTAFVTILSRITTVCQSMTGGLVPILLHGYAHPVPDGRGFLGGWGPLPGPWLQPGFHQKGFGRLEDCTKMMVQLIDRFNRMVRDVASLSDFKHVRYIDLRPELTNGPNYENDWANELHPNEKGFKKVTKRFADELAKL
jgi:lysophospholipase L1-like esterase